MQTKKEIKALGIVKRGKSFAHAFRGVHVLIETTPNVWIQFTCGIVAVLLGWHFQISEMEWIAVVFAIGLVVVAEAFNTAIEIDIDLTSPEFHPYARNTKDVAAGAVLLASLCALAIGLIIFLPKIFG